MMGQRSLRGGARRGAVVFLVAGVGLGTASAQGVPERRASVGDADRPTPDEASADALFRAASAAYANGDYRAAAHAYEDADRRAPRAGAIYNAAIAWDAAKEGGRAVDAFARALGRSDLDPALARAARERLATWKQRLGCVSVEAAGRWGVSVAHVQDRPVPILVCAEPGKYPVLLVAADGQRLTRTVDLRAGQIVALIQDGPPSPPRQAGSPGASRPGDRSASTVRAVGWSMVAASVALTGAAAYLGVRTIDVRDDFDAGGQLDRDLHDQAVRLRTWTNVAWIGAALTGVAGVGILLWPVNRRRVSPQRPAMQRATLAWSNLRLDF
jgi:hypothetical protein